MTSENFMMLAKAAWMYYQQGYDLFSGSQIADELDQPESFIRKGVQKITGMAPEKLAMMLHPDNIKKRMHDSQIEMKSRPLKDFAIRITRMEATLWREESINYSFAETRLGEVLIASVSQGVCYLAFSDGTKENAIAGLKKMFPDFLINQNADLTQQQALSAFEDAKQNVRICVKATAFQMSAWKKMLQIPSGCLMSYSALVGNKKDAHAFGAAVGSNPIAYLIPCHRMVPATGEIGNYHWGSARKLVLICRELAEYSTGKAL